MDKEFDLLVFIGRFQPFHVEHKRVIDTALAKAKNVLVLVGSSGKARTIRNPFTFDERKEMINGSFEQSKLFDHRPKRLIIKPLYDKTYNDAAWVKQVQDVVKETALDVINGGGFRTAGLSDAKVGLIGASKDNTSYYLKLFPQWSSVNVPLEREMHATVIREHYLDGTFEKHLVDTTLVPHSVSKFLFDEFIHTEAYTQLRSELEHVRNYKKAWEVAPYPVKHMTVDAVVEQSGHVLLVKRKAEPGKGLWAIPGGHLEMGETTMNGAIRELYEETKIKVPKSVLRGSIVAKELFDDPHRSTIGRVITHAFHFKLADDVVLPKVKGADDAEKAKWVPISELREDQFFDDHFHIISYFLGL